MESFFKVEKIYALENYLRFFSLADTEKIKTEISFNRILAENIYAKNHVPGFNRSTMDGFAVRSADTFGASHSSPLILNSRYRCTMGKIPDFTLQEGEAASIGTGGMIPDGADAVVIIENTSRLSENEIEIYASAAPFANTVKKDDDYKKGSLVLEKGTKITKKNIGALVSSDQSEICVFKTLKAGIISTGDEIDENKNLAKGKIRDLNRHILSAICLENGFEPVFYGVSNDTKESLEEKTKLALQECSCVIISGGSSVGTRDITIKTIEDLEDSEILVHGLAMSPGKPAIIARAGKIPVFGLPGNPFSCFCVFYIAVIPFLKHISGMKNPFDRPFVKAALTRNVYSASGRTDFIRVKLHIENNNVHAIPIPGHSGLSRPLAQCDGLLEIPENKEGGIKGEIFFVHLIQ